MHTHISFLGIKACCRIGFKYICPFTQAQPPNTPDEAYPNKDKESDIMIQSIAHEIVETVSDPWPGAGWGDVEFEIVWMCDVGVSIWPWKKRHRRIINMYGLC